ncbi:hypothetical protein [Solibacillus daqui]|uniref:hypothetical protein n=1 Tax=Solibacillus daqui TaxID=2912187 RepID=UPI0023652CCD|nr:hypothetical protein [Solibacillus daqui]
MKKVITGAFAVILSTGLLYGCGTANDEQEPDPTEEPSEQQEDQNDNQNDNHNDNQDNNH